MRTPGHNEGDETDLRAPDKLVSALKQLPQKRPVVPSAVDSAVLRAARRHFGQYETQNSTLSLVREALRRFPYLLPWLAGTTVILTVVIFVSRPMWGPRTNHSANAPSEAGISRRMDILDALKLARRLQSGAVRDPRWDINCDGVVDERDVQAIARRAVQLEQGGRS